MHHIRRLALNLALAIVLSVVSAVWLTRTADTPYGIPNAPAPAGGEPALGSQEAEPPTDQPAGTPFLTQNLGAK